MRPSSRALTAIAALLTASSVGAVRPPARGTVPPWYSLDLPAPAARMAEAAGLPAPAAPEYLLADLIRVLHERPIDPDHFAAGALGAVLRELESQSGARAGAGAERGPTVVPLPLSPATWRNAILGQAGSPAGLASSILRDRRAALLYVGLLALDAGTLSALERHPALLATLYSRHASAFAAFGAGLVIRQGAVVLPGPSEAQAAWEALVGAPAADPGTFVPALYGRDRGRLAYFYDAVARLDEPHRRYALRGSAPTAVPAEAHALYEVFTRVSPEWQPDLFPFYRPHSDPAVALGALRVTDEGRLAPPSSRRLWTRVFGDHVAASGAPAVAPPGDEASAAWLLDRMFEAGPRTAAARLAQVRFAQRVFAEPTPDDDGALAEALVAAARFPALAQALERLGVVQPRDCARAARLATALPSRGEPGGDAASRLALFQGTLAMIVRATAVRTLEPETGQRLAASLFDLGTASDDFEGRILDWLASHLLPAMSAATGTPLSEPAERVALRALAGARPHAASERTGIEWEGLRYRVDVAAGEIERLERLRARQGPPTLDQSLALHRAVSALANSAATPGSDAPVSRPAVSPPTRSSSLATRGSPIRPFDGVSRQITELEAALAQTESAVPLRQALARARRQLDRARTGGGERRPSRGAIRDIVRARTLVAADVVTALAYLPYLGDPDGQSRLGGHVARRHSFGGASTGGSEGEPAWSLPRERVTPEEGWHVQGALVGLDAALARLALRRLDVDRIPADPRFDEQTRALFVVDAALADPYDVNDRERDRIVEALAAGRARARRLADHHEDLDEIAAALQVEGRRLNLLRWAVSSGSIDPSTRFSLAELVRLGARQPMSSVPVTVPDGSCPRTAPGCPRPLTDLAIRLLEGLAELRLPAILLSGLLAAATQDFVEEAQPLHADDRHALWRSARELPLERIEDYVSALAGSGPLVFETPAEPSGARR